jgi:hypothetical protein
MRSEHHGPHSKIDWESVFERVAGSVEAPLSHEILARHLERTQDFTFANAWLVVDGSSREGNLLLVRVETFPDVYEDFYFIPRVRFEDAGTIYIPFWNYVCNDVLSESDQAGRAELKDRLIERAGGDVSDWALTAIDEHLEELTPICEPGGSLSRNHIPAATLRIYKRLLDKPENSTDPPNRCEVLRMEYGVSTDTLSVREIENY